MPVGPTNNQALLYGFAANFCRIVFARSGPMNSEIFIGRYFSQKDCAVWAVDGRAGSLPNRLREIMTSSCLSGKKVTACDSILESWYILNFRRILFRTENSVIKTNILTFVLVYSNID